MDRSLSSERDERLAALFDEAVERDAEARRAYLDRACDGDPDLRREVESLLAAFDTHAGDVRQILAALPLALLSQVDSERDGHDSHGWVGRRIAHYQIIEKLGGGGMGVVYRALDTRLDRYVALKFLPPHLSFDEVAKARFIHEAKAASALDHTNICTIYEVGEAKAGSLFIAMACYEGETIKAKLAGGPLPVEEALDYAAQIAKGLARAHEAGIIHRDVKPANVMVTERGRVKILDFGLAKVQDVSLTKTGARLGTAAYMSPEQARGDIIDEQTDLWALGVVLYEMLTGQRPFQGDAPQAAIYSILNEAPVPVRALRPGIPEALESVVGTLLQKGRAARYQRAEDALADLVSIQRGDEMVQVTRAPIPTRVTHWRPVVRWSSIALLVTALVLLGRLLFVGGEASITSLAVLPLANHSGDLDNGYFADGMHEALIGELAQIGALRVISRTSAMRYQDSDKSIPEIAHELNVDAVVEASLVRAGERVRIRVQLIQALPKEQHLWTQVYDRDMQDVMALHSDVARAIARQIQVTLTPQEESRLTHTRRVNPQAYEAYLKGRFYLYKLSSEHYETALRYFESARDVDPDYAPAHAGIASVWLHRGLWGGVPPLEANERLQAAAKEALALDSTLAETYVALGTGYYCYAWDWDASEAALKKAIELNPNHVEARLFYGDFLLPMKEPEKAIAQMERALELDPLNPFSHTMLGWALFASRRYDEAIVQLREALSTEPSNLLALRCLWSIYHLKGWHQEALETAKRFYRAQGADDVAEGLAHGFDAGGYEAAYRIAGNRLAIRSTTTYVPAMRIARLYTFAGDTGAALHYLDKAYEERFPSMFALNVDPHWDRLRGYPRFRALLEKMRLDA